MVNPLGGPLTRPPAGGVVFNVVHQRVLRRRHPAPKGYSGYGLARGSVGQRQRRVLAKLLLAYKIARQLIPFVVPDVDKPHPKTIQAVGP